jgi:crossover junction endodeoxyribonuclease RusA
MRQDCEPFTGEVRIRVIYNASDNRRRDTVSGNYAPSWKAAIDGLVDAGIIPDDSDSIVSELSVVRGDDMSEGSQLIVQVIGEDST